MAKLIKYTLAYNDDASRWDLRRDGSHTVKSFKVKHDGTKGRALEKAIGALEKAIGSQGGSVKSKKCDGKIHEKRTFLGSTDPHSSEG